MHPVWTENYVTIEGSKRTLQQDVVKISVIYGNLSDDKFV